EGEIREEMTSLCSSVLMKLSNYATITLDAIGKCPTIRDNEADTVAKNWDNTCKVISQLTNSMLSGHDDYCYVAKSRLQINQAMIYFNYKYDYYWGSSISNKNYTHPEYGYSVINTDAAQLLTFLKRGNPQYENMSFEDYVSTYVETEYPGYNSAWGQPSKPKYCMLNSNYIETKYSTADTFDLQHFLGYEWDDTTRYSPKNFPYWKDVEYNYSLRVPKIMDTKTGDISNNDDIIGALIIKYKYDRYNHDTQGYFHDKYFSYPGSHYTDYADFKSNGELYSLVVPKDAAKTSALKMDKSLTDENFMMTLNETIDVCMANGGASAFGTGDVIYTIVLALAGAAIIASICYVRFKKRKNVSLHNKRKF
ncbi:MAG: hypothetical protein MJ189_05535, partial [Coriobacteriales bacterium]|nr:hypothetical protein [Coriobacteriales bacterium]